MKQFEELFERELIEEINRVAKTVEFAQGDVFLNFGEELVFMPIVLTGVLKVVRTNDSGAELLLYYLSQNEGCAMTFTCCMERAQSEIKIIAEEDSTLLLIPMSEMDHWIQKFPTWKTFVMQTIRWRYNELLEAIDQIAFHKLDERLINYLTEKSQKINSPLLNISHVEIANDLATSREVVSRLLKKLEVDGHLLLYRNQIKLLSSK